MNNLPSEHQIEESVWFTLWSKPIASEIHGVSFLKDKILYDLKVFGENGEVIRLYRIDPRHILKTVDRT